MLRVNEVASFFKYKKTCDLFFKFANKPTLQIWTSRGYCKEEDIKGLIGMTKLYCQI